MDEVDHHVSRWKDPVMRRRISLFCVLLILFTSGCSAPQKASVAQIDCDGERMASVIAQKGQANEYETVVPPESSRLGEYLDTTVKVAGITAVTAVVIAAFVPIAVLYVMTNSLNHFSDGDPSSLPETRKSVCIIGGH